MRRAGEPEFVLDCSVAMSWCFKDESDPYAMAVLGRIQESSAVVPALWRLETANVILIAERRRRIEPVDSIRIVDFLSGLPIVVDENEIADLDRILELSRAYNLTPYDATYLDLAKRLVLPIATLDDALIKTSQKAGVQLFKA